MTRTFIPSDLICRCLTLRVIFYSAIVLSANLNNECRTDGSDIDQSNSSVDTYTEELNSDEGDIKTASCEGLSTLKIMGDREKMMTSNSNKELPKKEIKKVEDHLKELRIQADYRLYEEKNKGIVQPNPHRKQFEIKNIHEIVSDEDYSFFKKNSIDITLSQIIDILENFDKKIRIKESNEKFFLVHDKALASERLKEFCSSQKESCSSDILKRPFINNWSSVIESDRTEKCGIDLQSIYNIYEVLRRHVMLRILQDSDWYSLFSSSTFENDSDFFSQFLKTSELYQSVNGEIIRKIYLYTYFLTIYEMKKALYRQSQVLDKNNTCCAGKYLIVDNILRHLINCFYSDRYFDIFIKHDNGFYFSYRKLHIDIFQSSKISKSGPNEVCTLLMNIKESHPILDFLNKIALIKSFDVLFPLNFVDRIINLFLKSIYPNKVGDTC